MKVWGYFAWNDVRNLVLVKSSMTRAMYNDILVENLLEASKRLQLSKDAMLQHDNDSKHTSHIVKNWFDEQFVSTIDLAAILIGYEPDRTSLR